MRPIDDEAALRSEEDRVLRWVALHGPLGESPRHFDDAAADVGCDVRSFTAVVERLTTSERLVRQVAGPRDELTGRHPTVLRITSSGQHQIGSVRGEHPFA